MKHIRIRANSNKVAASFVCLLNTWNVTSVTVLLNFLFNFN